MFRLLPKRSIRSVSVLSGVFGASSKMESKSPLIRPYQPKDPDGSFPYSQADLLPMDAGNDEVFYTPSRIVTHIDDNAIISLKKYYDDNLGEFPEGKRTRILDFCSSWISHYPPRIFKAVESGQVEVLGTGMNGVELKQNPVLKAWTVQNLNEEPILKIPGQSQEPLDISTCVVSIDYLTKPVDVLRSIKEQTRDGGTIHLAISNRCFPTKAVGRWLRVDEQERLKMVGDYLWWSGWRDIEMVTVVEGSWTKDPLWIVRATKT